MNGLFLYYYINFFFNIHGYTFSFYDYALSPALEVLYFVCSYPEIIPTVYMGIATLYTRKYYWGFIVWIIWCFLMRIIKCILTWYFIHAVIYLIILQIILVNLIRFYRQINIRDTHSPTANQEWAKRYDYEMRNLLSFRRGYTHKKIKAGFQHINMECSICLCAFEYDEVLTKSFRCRHLFHEGCCEEWLKRSAVSTCPLCRSERL